MAAWFRMYAEILDDPKVQKLSGDDFKLWANLLALACRHDGKLPDIECVAFALRIDVHGAATVLSRLADATLLDRCQGGVHGMHYAPHGWAKRQYKSDGSTERVKRFRNVARNVTETGPETDTDTDNTLAKAKGADAPQNVVQIDPLKALFDQGVSLLTGSGVGDKQARSLIGKWRRDYGDGKLLEALTDCRARSPTNPLEWMVKALAARGYEDPYSIEATRPLL